jgi:ATP-binding protein involved in chromosome partitioning
MDIELMSIGFFIQPNDALMWRGAMATSALKQLLHQTMWGGLDFLLIDMPPGTGDIHLTMISEIKLDGAVIVSTPQQIAVADVVRGVEMFRHEQVNVPVLGIIENMAWFTPKELPDNKYYIFGKGGARAYAEEVGVPFLGDIPIVQSIMEGSESGQPSVGVDAEVERYYREIAQKIVASL